MNGLNQFLDLIFETRSFLPLRTIAFCPTSNFLFQLSVAQGTIRDTLFDFAIAISNSLVKSALKATKSSWGGPTANLRLIPKSISKGDFPSVPGRLRYPRESLQVFQLRPLLLTITFCIARFNVLTILSTLAFPLGLYAEIIFHSIDALEA